MADTEQKPQEQQQGQGKGKGKESKQDRKAQKAAAAEERRRKEIEDARKELEKYSDIVGDLPLIQSKAGDFKKRPYISIGELDKSFIGKSVLVRARIHFSFVKGGVCFVHLRDQHFTVQATIAKGEKIPACFVKFVGKVQKESIVDVEAAVVRPNNETGVVDLATQSDIELTPSSFFVVSRAAQTPVVMEDLETPQPILDAQEISIAEIEKEMEPLWKEKREIEEKPQIPKKIVDGAVKEMNAARAAVEKQKKDIQKLQQQIKEAEEALVQLEENAAAAVKVVQETKDEVKKDAAKYKQTSEEKARLKAIAAELKPFEEKKKEATKARMVGLSHRLDNRIIDLRTVANQAIFRIQSGVCTLFREVLLKKRIR
jgi:aspartyl/asparaginyl-tRNA synthetase